MISLPRFDSGFLVAAGFDSEVVGESGTSGGFCGEGARILGGGVTVEPFDWLRIISAI